MMKCEIGSIIQSTAGRDKGKYFVVLKMLNSDYAYLVDGKTRKLSVPKKKKIKHLMVCGQELELKEKIEQSRYLLDSDIRCAIQRFKLNK